MRATVASIAPARSEGTATPGSDSRAGRAGERRRVRLLPAVVVLLLAASSATGLWWDGLYADAPGVAAMFRGYDLVGLVLVAPLLAASTLPRWRERPHARLLTASMLTYCVYSYGYYVFGASMSAAFLLHVGTFTSSLAALVVTLADLNAASIAGRWRPRTPVRAVAGVLALLAAGLASIWVLGAVRFAVTGEALAEPSKLVVTAAMTRLGAVLDLSLLLPAYAVAAALLWRRRPWGLVLGTMLLVSGTLHQVSYMVALAFQGAARVPGAAFDPVEPFIALLFAAATVALLGGLRGGVGAAPPVTRPAPTTPGG